MGSEEVLAVDELPTDEAIQRVEQGLQALRLLRHFERRLANLKDFYQSEAARIEARIASARATYDQLCGRRAVTP